MTKSIRFETSMFDPRCEPRNPINPIGGHSVLVWLRGRLPSQVELSEPQTEDWGWYVDATFAGQQYMVGASSFGSQDEGPPMGWIVQVHKDRSVLDKILRRNMMAADDPFAELVFDIVRNEPEFSDVEVDI